MNNNLFQISRKHNLKNTQQSVTKMQDHENIILKTQYHKKEILILSLFDVYKKYPLAEGIFHIF